MYLQASGTLCYHRHASLEGRLPVSGTRVLGILLVVIGVVVGDIMVSLAMSRAEAKLYMTLLGLAVGGLICVLGIAIAWPVRRGKR